MCVNMETSRSSSSSSVGLQRRRRHVVIICYYEIRDSLMSAARALSAEYSCSTEVAEQRCIRNDDTTTRVTFSHYPLLEARQEFSDDEDKILYNFQDQLAARMIPEDVSFTCGSGDDDVAVILLWWYVGGISPELIRRMMLAADGASVHGRAIHVMYNWDDPYVWTDGSNDMKSKAPLFDVALVSCQESCAWYVNAGVRMAAVYCLPGFDPEVQTTKDGSGIDDSGSVDVSICCTNLYENKKTFPEQLSPSRKAIVDAFAAQSDVTFRIYGPATAFAEKYKENYGGELRYTDTHKAFANSRLNICTHVVGNRMGYMSERVSLVLGSGGLLWMDRVPQALLTEEHVAFIEMDENTDSDSAFSSAPARILQQAKRLLAPENAAVLEAKRQQGRALALQRLTWFSWARRVKKYIEFSVARSFTPEAAAAAAAETAAEAAAASAAAVAVVDISLPDVISTTERERLQAAAAKPIRISERRPSVAAADRAQTAALAPMNRSGDHGSHQAHDLTAKAAKISYCLEHARVSRHACLLPKLLKLSRAAGGHK